MFEVQVFDSGHEVGTFDVTTIPVAGEWHEELEGKVLEVLDKDGWYVVSIEW